MKFKLEIALLFKEEIINAEAQILDAIPTHSFNICTKCSLAAVSTLCVFSSCLSRATIKRIVRGYAIMYWFRQVRLCWCYVFFERRDFIVVRIIHWSSLWYCFTCLTDGCMLVRKINARDRFDNPIGYRKYVVDKHLERNTKLLG